jgi:urease accessory protein
VTVGSLGLTADCRGGRTVLTQVFRSTPFHPGPVTYRGKMAEVILQEVGPGIMPGDRLAAEVRVADGAALTVLGQGATRLYPSTNDLSGEMRTSLTVHGRGTLWWLPGPLIPFQDARYAARTEVTLDEESRFAYLEVITPGRTAMGERFAYRQLDLRLRIEVGGKPRLIERAILDPLLRPLALAGSQGAFTCAGTLVTVGYPVPPALDCGEGVWFGADGDAHLTIVRGVAQAVDPLRAALVGRLQAMAS